MKQIFFISVLCLLSAMRVWAQDENPYRVIDTTMVFNTDSYSIIPDFDDENAFRILGYSPTMEKPFPGLMISCGILEDEVYEDCVAEFTDKVIIKEGTNISLGTSHGYLKETHLQNVEEGEVSPVSFLDKTMKGYWRKKTLFIYPFHYDYPTKTLSLWTKVQLRVRMKKYSEHYRPFIEDGKEWITGQLISSEGYKNTYSEISRLYFDGDTLVGDRLCKRWMKQTAHLLEPETTVSSTLIAPIFEENQQVFFFYPNETIPRLLYDFQNQDEKQHIEVYSIYDDTHRPHIFTRTTSTKDYDSEHYPVPARWYEVNPEDNNEGLYSQTWIEGIGSKLSPDLNIFGKSETLPVMSKCQVGNLILCRWWADDLTAIRDVNTLNSKRSALNNIFDLSGRRVSVSSASSVSSVLPRGVYIKDGKKVVVK